jgi:RNA polymerase sigma factor (sigma-70 family)
MSVRQRGADEAVGELYQASYARLVSVVAAIGGDRHEAEEAVQDAFVRLLDRWSTVSAYDDPEAWLRKVALGFLSNRRRKLRNGVRALVRSGPTADVPGPTAERIDLERAVAALPQQQRAVITLQRLGLEVEAIGHELNIPVGTVKSRLSGARRTLAPLLREDVNDHV